MFVRVAIKDSKMSQFDAVTFMSGPSEDTFFALKRQELISLARYLELDVTCKNPMSIAYIQSKIILHLVDIGVFGRAVLSTMSKIVHEEIEIGRRERLDRLKREEKERHERRERERKEQQERWERERKKRQERLERAEKERQERLERAEKERQERLERAEKERQERLERAENERQERLKEKERQERLEREKKERQERLEREEKERQEMLQEKEGQERLEVKERQERLEEKKLAQQKLKKEKLLSSNNDSINLLQNVSDSCTKPFRACEARANLSSSQKSMKKKYDVDAVERSFKPGQKVLSLLPVPSDPLNSRYFGPYVIQKKLSDLNYVVVTPDRRKQTQLCHVNMLKPYVERSSDPVSQPVNVNVVASEPKEDLGSELSSNSFGPTDTTRLTNTDVLRNLDSKLSHLTESQRQDLKKLLLEFEHLFPDVPTRTDQIYHDVDVGNADPVKQHPYRLNPSKQKYLKEEIKYLLENDFIEPSNSSWSSPCILVPKPDGSYRMCTDYRKVNSATKTDTFPIPRMDDCIDKVGKARYVTKFDLLKGFWQVPLTDRAKEISAFVTPDGLYQYKVMPFGMKNSPASFQRLINKVIADLEGCEAYIDDVIIYSDTWEEHLRIIREFFERLSRAMLTINLSKSEFGQAQVTYLGHVVGQGEVKPVSATVKAIANFPRPESKKQLMRFLGMAGYYRRFCPNFAAVAEPLTQLLSKREKFIWSERCDKAFEELKAMLQSAPVLAAPDFESSFKLAVDASDVAAGAVLLQEDDEGVEHPVCYFSKKFNKSQRNYSTIEKECLALMLALQHFEVYISSSSLPIVVYSDHNPLVFIHKMKDKNQRLLRWSIMLQEYVLEIRHIKGKDNVIADCLSRV